MNSKGVQRFLQEMMASASCDLFWIDKNLETVKSFAEYVQVFGNATVISLKDTAFVACLCTGC